LAFTARSQNPQEKELDTPIFFILLLGMGPDLSKVMGQ
jgi:hypothetical protein